MSASPKFDPNPLGPLGPFDDFVPHCPELALPSRRPTPHSRRALPSCSSSCSSPEELFGYDQGVISGALAGIKLTFALSPLIVEVVTSWITLGALFGALVGGELADSMGRKRTVLIAGVLLTWAPRFELLPLQPWFLWRGASLSAQALGSRRWRRRSMRPSWRPVRGEAASCRPISSP